MRSYTRIAELQSALNAVRAAGKRIAFVPTMGNLHDGHLQLVRRAHKVADFVVVSVFVNPLQFGAGEDLESYPRTLSADREKLFGERVQALFIPDVAEMYPRGMAAHTQITVPAISDTLCGTSRPGHFTGVATVVCKLLNIVRPDCAIFGEKDFQQLSVIRRMVEDLCIPVQIIGEATARALDGLALSSRNGYLSSQERQIAPVLHQALQECREAIACGFDNYRELEAHARLQLEQAGFEADYFAIRDAKTLQDVSHETEEIAILGAARLGSTRLIDNVRLSLNPISDWGMLAAR
jgi:pantoate--beta-alanine ligase